MAQLNANLENHNIDEGFDCLKPGWYEARIENSEIKQGAKGPYINWTLDIVGHPNKVWEIMSLGNDFSMIRLKTMATCCGHRNPNYIADTEELHGMTCLVKLKIEEDETGKYDPKNRVSKFKKLEQTVVTLPPLPAVEAPTIPVQVLPPTPGQDGSGKPQPWTIAQ